MSKPALKYAELLDITPAYEPHKLCITPPAVGWMDVGARGLGICALRDIKQGEVIEYSPVVVMSMDDLYRSDDSEIPIGAFAFHWGEENEKGESITCAIVKGGYLALANHSKNGNSDVQPQEKDMVIKWFATKDIAKGEEVTFDYDCDLWFDDLGKK